MFVGKVIGTVWSTVKWPQVQGLKLLVVRPYHLADLADLADQVDSGHPPASSANPASPKDADRSAAPAPFGGPDSEAVVCVDLLDAGVGDDVVVAFGHAARVAAQIASGPQGQSDGRSGRQGSGTAVKGGRPEESRSTSRPGARAPETIVPIDAAVVAIVDSIRVARPLP